MQGLRGARHSRRGWRALLLLVLLALLLTPSVALADKPTREPAPAFEPPPFAAGEVCAFPVLIEETENKAKALTFIDDSGAPLRQIITGKFRVRVTNLATGESLVVNVSGPGFLTFTEGELATVTLGGRGLLFLRAGIDVPPAGIFLLSGRTVLGIGAQGEVTSIVSQTGRVQDLCAALAR
jgi:hypothetical protein